MRTRNPRVPDVPRAFGAIRQRAHFLAAWDGGKFAGYRYTADIKNAAGLNNHFQGIVRLGRHVVISGGDPHREGRGSQLFVIEMGSRQSSPPFRSNLWPRTRPPDEDRVVKVVNIDTEYWHAGGIDASGDLLAVPIQFTKAGKTKSQILFYDFSAPTRPRRLDPLIDRPTRDVGAVAITRLEGGQYLVAAWTDAGGGNVDLYLSAAPELDGFAALVRKKAVRPRSSARYQGVSFVTQADGALFLIGFENTSAAAPTIPGVDLADLWALSIKGAPAQIDRKALVGCSLTHLGSRAFKCKDRQANMDAGAGAFVDGAGALHAYSCFHWRQDGQIRFSEFRATPSEQLPAITDIRDAWIDLYQDENYGGHCLALAGGRKRATHLRDYSRLHVEGSNFNDKVSSVRFQIPAGQTYRLFEDREYTGTAHNLGGTGTVQAIPGFPAGDKISSSRWV